MRFLRVVVVAVLASVVLHVGERLLGQPWPSLLISAVDLFSVAAVLKLTAGLLSK